MFIDLLDRFRHNLFIFLPCDYWHSTDLGIYEVPTSFLRFSTSKCSYYVLIFHGMFLPVNVKNSIDFNNSLQLLHAVQQLSILCMLDTTFGVWLWSQLNWCNIYILCYIKASFLKNMNNFYCNFLCLNFLICFYFLPISTFCSYISSFL